MRTCAACGEVNDDAYRFCGSCGAALGLTCPMCGFVNGDANRFCGSCGAALDGAAKPAPILTPAAATARGHDHGPTHTHAPAHAHAEHSADADLLLLARSGPPPIAAAALDERKVATVLFADVVGFTSLSETTDPETVARTVDAAFRRIGEVVAAHGGTVDKYMGDCVMAVFGVPVAHDDDAERAVACGLAMRGVGGDLAFSIGINTGEVMVTAVGRDGDLTVIGDAVNVAARLEKEAGPGEVLVGRLTAELARDRVELVARKAVILKGKRAPVEAFEAVALREGSQLLATDVLADAPPLVGRDDELAFLRSQWRRVKADGGPAFLILTGDAGMGKTRLLDELSRDLASTAADGCPEGLVVRTSYPGYGGMGGPRLAADLIRQLGWSGDGAVDARVKSVSGELHPSLKSLDPAGMFNEQVWAFRKLLAHKAVDGPILIAIDDCHRSGGKMIDLLRELMARVNDIPVMLILAGRNDPNEWITQFPSATVLRLSPLSRSETLTLGTAMAAGCADVEGLVERSGGNPLYLRELVARVRQQGGVATLPPTLQAILAARLDALSPMEKTALQHVAVIGEPTTVAEVEALGPPGVGAALAPLVASGLMRQGGAATYDVHDQLLREVAYETLPRHVRGERHRLVAAASDDIERKARHMDRAAKYLEDDPVVRREAGVVLAAAARHMLDTFREIEAMRLLSRAVELGHRDPGDLLRLALQLGHLVRPAEALEVLALLPDVLEDPADEAERIHITAVVANELDETSPLDGFDDAAARWEAVGNVEKQAWAHANKGFALFNRGRGNAAARELDTALDLFKRIGDRQGQIGVFRLFHLCRPEDPRVSEWLSEGLAQAEESGDSHGQLATLMGLSWFYYLRERLGGIDDIVTSDHYCHRMLTVAREVGSAALEGQALGLLAVLHRQAGDLDVAMGYAAQAGALAASEQSGEQAYLDSVGYMAVLARDGAKAWGTGRPPTGPAALTSKNPLAAGGDVIVAESLLMAGSAADAIERLDAGHRIDLGSLGAAMGGAAAGWAQLVLGNPAKALECVKGNYDLATTIGWRPGVAAVQAVSSMAHLALDDRDAAVAALERIPQPLPGGIAGALVYKAQAALGDGEAAEALAAAAIRLAAPGLLL